MQLKTTRDSRGDAESPPMAAPEDAFVDRAFLERVIDGDSAARQRLFDEFAPQLYRRLERRYAAIPGIDAEDLLHDAFIFFFQNDAQTLQRFLDRYPGSQRRRAVLAGYLWDQACGLASNRRRSHVRRTRAMSRLTPAESADHESQALVRDALRRLEQCLSGAGRRVLLYYKLRYVEGLTAREVARLTDWALPVVYRLRIRLGAAVERCRERLGLR